MKLPESPSIKDLISLLESQKELCEEHLKICEEALKTLKHPKHMEYWKRERDSLKNRIKEIEGKLAVYRKIAS